MALIQTNDGRIVLKKAKSMMVVPYVYKSTISNYALGNDVYDISSVIGDSITIEQSDGNIDTKYNEFKASPLLECFSGMKYKFSAQCIDLQNNVLQSLFGVMVSPSGSAAFNDEYVELYALVKISFEDNNLPYVILPKVCLNSKLFIQQLHTRCGQGNIEGTVMPYEVAVSNPSLGTVLSFQNSKKTTYIPNSPVIFVPNGYNTFVYYTKKGSEYYSLVNFVNGSVRNDIIIDRTNGSINYDLM